MGNRQYAIGGPNLILRLRLILGPHLILGPNLIPRPTTFSFMVTFVKSVEALFSMFQLLLLFSMFGFCLLFFLFSFPICIPFQFIHPLPLPSSTPPAVPPRQAPLPAAPGPTEAAAVARGVIYIFS